MERYKKSHLNRLLQEITRKAGVSQTYSGLVQVVEQLPKSIRQGMSEEFLYKRIYLPLHASRHQEEGFLKLQSSRVESLAKFLGFQTFRDFIQYVDSPLSPVLKSCEGLWYSYVRSNSGKANILRSPVRITQEKNSMLMTMQGPVRQFTGELKIGSCDSLFCLLEAKQKTIHLVLKLGVASCPNVLMGVFSGISTGGDPIAGREVLIRQSSGSFNELKPACYSVKDLKESAEKELIYVAAYFREKEGNVLKASRPSTFELDDLLAEDEN